MTSGFPYVITLIPCSIIEESKADYFVIDAFIMMLKKCAHVNTTPEADDSKDNEAS